MSTPKFKKKMVCVDCLMVILATSSQASRHGWKFWMGGARCARCYDKAGPGEAAEPAPVGAVTCLICLADGGDE